MLRKTLRHQPSAPILVHVSNYEVEESLHAIDADQLIFFLDTELEISRLTAYIRRTIPEFKFIKTSFDNGLIVAGTPKLGTGQLGTFAARKFNLGDMIVPYEGKNLYGSISLTAMEDKLKAELTVNRRLGDYLWDVDCGNEIGMAIDSRTEGSAARFINHADVCNCEAVYLDNKLFYVAKRNISVGEEITVAYGKEYFTGQPYIEYPGDSLNDILLALERRHDIGYISRERRQMLLGQIKNRVQHLGWYYNQQQSKDESHMDTRAATGEKQDSTPTCIISLKRRAVSSPYLSNNKPLFFDCKNNNDVTRLNGVVNKVITTNAPSSRRLWIAAVHDTNYLQVHTLRYALFTLEPIAKNQTICTITGVEYTAQELKNVVTTKRSLFQVNDSFIDYEKFGSEAVFIHGASAILTANVRLKIINKQATYVACKDIEPGAEIVAFFGKQYHEAIYPTHLRIVVADFNKNQAEWTATLKMDKGQFSLDLKNKVASKNTCHATEPENTKRKISETKSSIIEEKKFIAPVQDPTPLDESDPAFFALPDELVNSVLEDAYAFSGANIVPPSTLSLTKTIEENRHPIFRPSESPTPTAAPSTYSLGIKK